MVSIWAGFGKMCLKSFCFSKFFFYVYSMMSEEQINKFHDVLLLIITEYIHSYASFYVIEFSRYSYVNALLRRAIQISV